MATAGYSGTPLVKKLNLNPGLKIRLINPPGNYFQLLETDLSSQLCPLKDTPDWIHLFAVNTKELCAVSAQWSGLKFVVPLKSR